MSGLELLLWGTVAVAGLVICGLFAGLETGFYCLSRVRLQLKVHQGGYQARIIAALINAPHILLGTLLMGMAIGMALSSGAAVLILADRGMDEGRIVLMAACAVAPVIIIVAQVLPKDLFAVHADRLVYGFARFMWMARHVLTWTGLLPLILLGTKALSRWVGLRENGLIYHPRSQIQHLVQESMGKGLISHEQSAMARRVLALGDRRVADDMVRWVDVQRLQINDTIQHLIRLSEQTQHSRFPVMGKHWNVLGVVNVCDALLLDKTQRAAMSPSELAQPAALIEASTPVRTALRRLQRSTVPMGIVVEAGRPVGIVTIKDLVEPIIGELFDW